MPSSESHYGVALELAQIIARSEKKVTQDNAREYFLDLYYQCRRVVYNGERPKDANSSQRSVSAMSW